MSDRTLKGLIGLVLTGLVAVIAAGAVLGSGSVAHGLGDRARTALAAAGLGDVLVDFRGREAELSGGNDVEIRRAETLVASLPGVRRVDVAVVADDVIEGVARFELDRAGDDVEINGVVPDPDAAAEIKVAVAEGLRTMITGDVAVDRSVAPARWADDLPDVFEVVAGVEGLELEIPGDGTVAIGGTVEDESERIRLLEELSDVLPGLEVTGTLDLATPTPDAG
ncbi:MAG: hypothetical protein JWR55_1238 [Aeromicrobium sp.]|nr:hypothetical protein [Aeromicrobium sp.]